MRGRGARLWLLAALLLATLLLAGCAGPRVVAPAAPRPTSPAAPSASPVLSPAPATVPLYALLEMDVWVSTAVENPFDPAHMDLRVRFSGPGGEVIVPAFWYQAFDPVTLEAAGPAGWKVRFTPTAVGEWRARAELIGGPDSQPVFFSVTPSGARGFVRLDPRNPRYFATDDGAPLFAIGLNLAWSTGDVLADYTRWLDRLSAAGGNTARVWMASWSFGIEWADTGLGDYSRRMQQAWLLDQVFALAEERGVYIMLTLLNHGAFSTMVNPEWERNPYNAALGGPCPNPGDFVTDAVAKQFFQRRLRYIAARWAYSPALLAWEWWNEVNWTPILDRDLGPWIEEMGAYLATHDPYDHLVTTSYADGTRSSLWGMAALDFAQHHDYSGRNPLQTFPDAHARIARQAGDKPLVFGELGFSTGDDANTASLDRIHFHNGLWAALFSGYASTALYWWWDTFVDPQNQWGAFRGLAGFVKGEDLALMTVDRARVAEADALLLRGEGPTLLWVRSRAYDVEAAEEAYSDAVLAAIKSKSRLTDWRYEPPLLEKVDVIVPAAGGAYQVRWYDPQTARWLAEETVEAGADGLVLRAPAFSRDLAARIVAR